MIIDSEVQLDFKDVLFAPQRSVLSSRSEVNLVKKYIFKSCNQVWTGIPIIAANMDTIGTMSMAKKLSQYQCMTALHKHYSIESLIDFFTLEKNNENFELLRNNQHHLLHSFYSMGITNKDVEKFEAVIEKVGYWNDELSIENNSGIKFVCIDVANGYMQSFVDFCKKIRKKHPKIVLMAGNVVSGDITQELILSGVDIVKAGIGGGCFVPGSKVITLKGLQNIETIKQDTLVLTHKSHWQPVTNVFTFYKSEFLYHINGIQSTEKHEYYVVNKSDEKCINDENIHFYAQWIPANQLTKKHYLIQHMSVNTYNLVEIASIEKEYYEGMVYDLEVGGEYGDHSYNINGIIVHNSVCTTRHITGVGRPQLSTVIDTANASHGLDGHICSDGGCTSSGDVAKAFGANADFVMLGGMLSGHIESEMLPFIKNGEEHFHYYGMSSTEAMNKHSGGVSKHRAPEGKIIEIKNKGTVAKTIEEILGGIRSTCTYTGSKSLKELPKRTKFYKVNMQTNDVFGKPK